MKTKRKTDKDTLYRIASKLVRIDHGDLTMAERQIVNILIETDYVIIDTDNQIIWNEKQVR